MEFDVLYVSPHADDVAFSAAASVARDVTLGVRVGLVTVFHAASSGPFGDGATRSAEDARYAAHAGVELAALGLPDAVTRHPRYRRVWRVMGPLAADEQPLVSTVTTEVARRISPRCRRIIGPLGIGNHVDHQIVHRAVKALAAHSRAIEIAYYEDAPYVLAGSGLEAFRFWSGAPLLANAGSARLPTAMVMAFMGRAAARGERSCVIPAVAEDKMAAIACYPSQWPLLYPSLDDWRDALRRYTASLGHIGIVERIWQDE